MLSRKKAGVSVGSLYQYVPNKLALIEAARRRHLDDVRAVLDAAADARVPRAQRIEALVDGMIDVHSRYPAAHRVLLEEVPRDTGRAVMHEFFGKEYRKGCEAVFKINVQSGAVKDSRAGMLVLPASLAGAVHEAARHGMWRTAAIRQELIALVDSYLSNG